MGTAIKTRKDIDALDLLTSQHDEVDAFIKQLEEGDLASEKKAAAFALLADNLAAHAVMEEKVFYPAILAKKTEDVLLESTEEHLAIRRVLADLLSTPVEDERFDARIKVLKEEVTHHAREEEEDKLFPMVRKMFTGEELTALGSEMLAAFEALMAKEPRKDVPGQTRRPASI